MRTSRELTDSYAEKRGYASRRFQLACIYNGDTRILGTALSSTTYRQDLEELFVGDVDSAYHALTFVWAQAWAVAVGTGLREKEADRLYDRFFSQIKEARTVTQMIDLHFGLLLAYAEAVGALKERPHYSPQVQKSCDYVAEHIGEPLSVRQIAQALGLSADCLSHWPSALTSCRSTRRRLKFRSFRLPAGAYRSETWPTSLVTN